MCVMMSLPGRGQVLRALCGRVPGGAGSARRRLFGAVDHEELQRDYKLLMKAELEDASHRWSFDFPAHKPRGGGDFEWVELSEARVPFLYHDCKIGSQQKGAWPGLKKEDVPTTPESCDRTPHTLKRKQTNITDFYQAKRRVVTTRKSGQ
ncbi:cyclin-dependent kinase inhibitor 1 isoform 1-T1 [Clarias gariepinus]|uniref:cyclin-dependent kinase inhibitor 1 isoform X1 n=2 Tax=Clarias gariepinus TaxID=13013 RepID=UPI00234D5C48|nr:cyclin-dependent kinase inhibitor 1 isoform X1 [Clarias gariepinus]